MVQLVYEPHMGENLTFKKLANSFLGTQSQSVFRKDNTKSYLNNPKHFQNYYMYVYEWVLNMVKEIIS